MSRVRGGAPEAAPGSGSSVRVKRQIAPRIDKRLRLFQLDVASCNEPFAHDRQEAVGFSHISVAVF